MGVIPDANKTIWKDIVKAMLPRGSVWILEDQPDLLGLVYGQNVQRIGLNNIALDLVDEADPSTTTDMIEEWERMLGIPIDTSQTIYARRSAVLSVVTDEGGQTPADMVEIIRRSIDTNVILDEFTASNTRCGVARCGVSRLGTSNPFAWTLHIDGGLPPGDPERLEALVARIKPAHTTVTFSYDL